MQNSSYILNSNKNKTNLRLQKGVFKTLIAELVQRKNMSKKENL